MSLLDMSMSVPIRSRVKCPPSPAVPVSPLWVIHTSTLFCGSCPQTHRLEGGQTPTHRGSGKRDRVTSVGAGRPTLPSRCRRRCFCTQRTGTRGGRVLEGFLEISLPHPEPGACCHLCFLWFPALREALLAGPRFGEAGELLEAGQTEVRTRARCVTAGHREVASAGSTGLIL